MMCSIKSESSKAKGILRTKSIDAVELQGNAQQQLVKPDSGLLLPPLRLQADSVYGSTSEKIHKKKKKHKHRKHKHNEDEANKEGNENHHKLEEQQLDSENL